VSLVDGGTIPLGELVNSNILVPRCKRKNGRHIWDKEDLSNICCLACGLRVCVRRRGEK
jgi:hypothetical protein